MGTENIYQMFTRLGGAGFFVKRNSGVGLISVPRVLVEARCLPRATSMSASQVMDYGSVPVQWRTLKFPEKNIVDDAVFEKELCEIAGGKNTGSWRTETCEKSAGCELHTLYFSALTTGILGTEIKPGP